MIEGLMICFEEIEKIVDMEFVILKEKENTILDSTQISKKYCLLAKDALTVSFARDYGIENIATNDSDFKRVDFLWIWKP